METRINALNTMRSVIGFDPEAIFVLSGGIAKNPVHGRYRPTAFCDLDPHGFMGGGKSRVIAAIELAQIFPAATIVPTSKDPKGNHRPHWDVMSQELIRRGVRENRIIPEKNSFDTISNLSEMLKLCHAHQWNKIAIISNEWHLPRIMLMYDQLPHLLESRSFAEYLEIRRVKRLCELRELAIAWVAAEDILLLRSEKYKTLLDKTKATTSYSLRLEAELRGITLLLRGTYGTS